jgi:DNA-binding MltR family transcriptional regulator
MLEELFAEAGAVFEFRKTLTPETDRGCALMAAAYLDEQLGALLRAVFVDSKIADELLEQSKPLGTFSSRIDAVFLLGLLSPAQRRDLHLIRKIRNDFGHKPDPITFEYPAIANRCLELTYSMHDERGDSRSHFTSSVFAVLATIDAALQRVAHFAIKPDPVVSEEMKRQTRELAAQLSTPPATNETPDA